MVRDKFTPLFTRLDKIHRRDPENQPRPPEYFNWHALRHFAISCWIEADLAPKTVQTFAGHSTLAFTMDRHGHLFKSDNHRAATDAIAAHVDSSTPQAPETLQLRVQLARDYETRAPSP
jgi:integrase